MAAFSRLQLAAALLEYDNDDTNPDAPKRSAYDSAIFAHIRRNNLNNLHGRKPDHLGVSLPSETISLGGRESLLETGRRGSVDALRNPFGADETVDSLNDDEEEDVEVDLASWGLDSFIPKEKGSKAARKKSKQGPFPSTQPVASLRHRPDTDTDMARRRNVGTRSMSLGDIDNVGPDGGVWATQSLPVGTAEARRRSAGSLLDTGNRQASQRPASSYALIQNMPESSLAPGPSVPFPSVSDRPDSVFLQDGEGNDAAPQGHERSYSMASLGAQETFKEPENPFAIRPPSRERASRFDPKANHPRTASNATMATMGTMGLRTEDRPSSRASKLDLHDPAHVRTMSNASMGSRMFLDNDGVSVMTGQYIPDRPYSTVELLRPKVLVMPSPLQTQNRPPSPPPVASREGFQLLIDGTPLPPGARSSRRNSANLPMLEQSVPVASNSFAPNPRTSLSLSQLTFRNTLVVGGERDAAYGDINRVLPRATKEGEQVRSNSPIEEAVAPETGEEQSKGGRPPGKPFGKSLIDDLETRKAQMRSKQRVFTGDERPSMMVRTQTNRSSTLIDPATLNTRPTSQHINSLGHQGSHQALGRRGSANIKPYLTFDDDENLPGKSARVDVRVVNSRSVFGVDTIWEREMVKLREIEAAEKREAEAAETRRLHAEEEAERRKNRKRKGKGKAKAEASGKGERPTMVSASQSARISEEPPTLPNIQKATRRVPPPAMDEDDDDDESDASDEDLAEKPSQSIAGSSRDAGIAGWHAGSSDEDVPKPQRTTGVGPRYKKPSKTRPVDEDSEEDLPLSVAVERVVQRANRQERSADSSDEEQQPLSVLLEKTKLSLTSSYGSVPDAQAKDDKDGDDDDMPLGLRASKLLSFPQTSHRGENAEDDDVPLAFHPEQQRRTQYQMLAQQQQQQQLLMQAQLQNSMFFATTPAMMAPGYFGQPLAPPMMVPPLPIPLPSPPPLHDAAKFGRVDKWRRDVIVERES